MANDAVIISDLHLGSDVCQARRIRQFLAELERDNIGGARELVVNGDLFDSWDFRKLKSSHWKVLSQLRKLSKDKHVVWINGNHDGPAEIISHLIGLDFVDEYEIVSGGRRILVLHGDRFDSVIAKYPLLTKMADSAYRTLQKLDGSFRLAQMAKRNSKTFLRCSEQVKTGAIKYCESKGADVVCCGHTHLATESERYCNSGCWTENQCNYLTVVDGRVSLHAFRDTDSTGEPKQEQKVQQEKGR